jgi:hypothetical protein
MRRLTLCVALIVLPCAFGEDKPVTKGVKIATKDGKVSAVFPHKPTEKKQGDLTLYLHESKDGKSAMLFNQYPLPKEVDLTDKALVKKVLDGGREGGIKSIKGKYLSKKDLQLGKYPGQTFDAEVAGSIYRARIYLTGKSLVQIVVLGPKEFVDSAEVKKFLDSLKLEE